MKILQFEGKYRFLSNFTSSPMIIDGKYYSTVENYFQSQKTLDEEESEKIRLAMSPSAAKRLGRQCNMREDWDEIKDEVMMKGLRAKFFRIDMSDELLATNNDILEEGNTWGDYYWGVDFNTGIGENKLGKFLMQLRDEIRRYQDEIDS